MARAALDDLRDVIESLTEEIRVLRMAVDDLRGELKWANSNQQFGRDENELAWLSPPLHITSLPLDPTATDWKINSVDEATVERLRQEAMARSRNVKQQQLF